MDNNNMGKLAIVFKEKWNRFSHFEKYSSK